MHLIIEFKQDSDVLIRSVHELLQKYDRLRDHRDYWFSLKEPINKKLYAYDPSIPRMTSVLGLMRVLLLHMLGVLPFVGIEECAVGVTLTPVGTLLYVYIVDNHIIYCIHIL